MSMTTYKVPPRWLFLKIETQSGYIGWGEPVVEGRADTVEACIHELKEYVIGRSAGDIEDIWQVLYRGGFYRGGPVLTSALSGIDQALWDIKGKYYNMPIYEMLGGKVRDKMRVYRWIGGDRPDNVAEEAQKAYKEGYNAVKMNGTDNTEWIDSFEKVEGCVKRVAAIREKMGYKLDIAVDFHGRIHKAMARILMKELEPFHLMFIEEPVLIENYEAFKDLRNHTVTPIATGERNYTRWDFKKMLQDGYVDIIQPDLSHAGGISEVRKIAAMAEAYDVALAPHCPLGPIALAACFQVDFMSINAFIQEQSLGIHYNQGSDLLDYLTDPGEFGYKDGYVSLPKKPGLGIDINEEKVKEMAKIGHTWKNPIWRNQDNSVAEW
ncbi:MAG: galactonate dehydratase [Clostridiaceae bacterium]|jgi:galactonate dehydratase|nr:galactonate dehydratase [Clostridiaceae bacterium]